MPTTTTSICRLSSRHSIAKNRRLLRSGYRMRTAISLVLFLACAPHAFAVQQAQREIQRTATLPPGRAFRVEHSFGNVSIRTQPGRTANIRAVIECSANSKERAETLCNGIEVSVQEGTDRVTVQTKVPEDRSGRNAGFQINYDIALPQDTPLHVENKYGSVDVRDLQANAVIANTSGAVRVTGGRGRRDIDNKFGDIDLELQNGDLRVINASGNVMVREVRGAVDINSRFGNITVNEATGGVTIVGASGTVDAGNITGGVMVTNAFGRVTLTGASSSVNVRNQSGAIRVEDVKESVDLQTTFDAITFSRIGKDAVVRGQSSNISGEAVGGNVIVDTAFGNIAMRGVRGDTTLRSHSGAIRVDGVEGMVSAKTSFNEMSISDVAGPVTADNDSGAVRVEPRSGKSCQPISIRTRFAPIRFRVPGGAGYNVEARTRFGRISSEIDLETTVRSASASSNQNVSLIGRIPGTGACDLRLTTDSGNIDILKGIR